MSDEHPMERIRRLSERLSQEAEAIGLHLEQVAIFPNMQDPDGPTLLQGVFTIRPDAIEEPEVVDESQIEFDKMFDNIIQGTQKDDEQEKLKGLAEDVKSWLDEK